MPNTSHVNMGMAKATPTFKSRTADETTPADLRIDCGTEKTIVLEQPVWDDLQVSVSLAKRPASNAPTWRTFDYGIGGGIAFPALGFGLNDYQEFSVQTQHAMKLNTILDNHIHWTVPSDDNATNIKFQLDVIVAPLNFPYAVPAGSPYSGETTLTANEAGYHRLLGVADIPASNQTVSTLYFCRLTRVAASSNDYPNEVYVSFNDCHYQKDMMGSRQEGIK